MDFELRTRLVFGPGSLERLGELARQYGARRVMLVSDAGVIAAGHTPRGAEILRQAGLEVAVFDGVRENPTTREVAAGVEFAGRHAIDFLIGLGGGSSMDCAKGVNFILTNGGRMADYWGVGKATQPMLPLIAVPTTAGTGSEAQSFALISDEATHVKMACGDKKAAPRVAILDPQLTRTCPATVTAVTGIDAISHALESLVSRPRTPVSMMLSSESWRRMRRALPQVLAKPDDLAARGEMLLGSHLAGAAIEASMLGIAHSLANPLTARYGITHGIAVGVMLPHVIVYNGDCQAGQDYWRLMELRADYRWYHEQGRHTPDDEANVAAEALAQEVGDLLTHAGLPRDLASLGVPEADLPGLAAEAAGQWTRQFNPRPAEVADLLELYQCAYTAN